MKIVYALLLSLCCALSHATEWNEKQKEIIDVMQLLSDASDFHSASVSDYANLLDDEFSRWTIGSGAVNDKQGWVTGVSTWIERGWRVAARNWDILDIKIEEHIALSRRVLTEAYLGPTGQKAFARTALAETWINREGEWRLLQVTVHPLPIDID